jgi:hypothetical protein
LKMDDFSVILFPSGTQSLWTARILKRAGIQRNLVPIPRSISSDCGYCVRIKRPDVEKVKELLEKNGIGYTKIEELNNVREE